MTDFTDQFAVVGEAVGPQSWMQLRLVATGQADGVSRNYAPISLESKNDLYQTLEVAWTNDSPISQLVYGMVTRGGSQVTLQARSRGYLSMSHGMDVVTGEASPTFSMIEVSRGGVGSDLGKSGLLSIGGAFGISSLHQNSSTMPFMPHATGWVAVAPGDTIHAKVQVHFISEFWENFILDGGDVGSESRVNAGDVRIDMFALPVAGPAPVAATPTIVGSVTYDSAVDLLLFNSSTSASPPEGLVEGDVLVGIVCNQWGFASEMYAEDDGWTLMHSRDAGWGNVHMKIYVRTITDDEPSEYEFENAPLAEEIVMLVGLRDAQPYDPTLNNWHVASNLSQWKFVEDQVAPSINRRGQLLLAASYFAHLGLQSPINQTPPTGMTELADVPATVSTLALAKLDNPPRPTLDREFTPSEIPIFTGHSITAAILIPGVLSV